MEVHEKKKKIKLPAMDFEIQEPSGGPSVGYSTVRLDHYAAINDVCKKKVYTI